jgi:Eco57I restriction-modification methylase/TaqI-like C-terminal specificity domain/N-6 DNA Methylase
VLRLLGHTFEVQPALATPEGTRRPDYVLYRDVRSVAANKGKTLTDESLKGKAFAVADAKYWDRPLDLSFKSRTRDAFSNKNPSFQISFYMQHSGTDWGILTNGRFWRLYHRDTAHKLDRFYEVDLPALMRSGSAEDFLYFYAFFRRAAFEDYPLGVGALLRESADYARSVGDSLKVQVYEALRHLAQGFLDHPRNRLSAGRGTLREIYDNSLILLYRLLFILYAESRDLLPVRESTDYRDSYSLYAIKHDVERNLEQGRNLLPTSATLWPRLVELFGIIAGGSPPLKVATFDGGLFDAERHPFLESHAVGDGHLQQAIDRLARVDGQFVDYRDLAERHLGTIYEGLLEYHFEALAEPEDSWTVDLLNDRGERKATGSYYTPDYVVKYIVEATVNPLLHEAVEGARSDDERVEAVLALNVLDPSMGSGHFLVEVTERIARFLVELGVAPEEIEADAELAHWKRRVAQSCVYGVDANPLAVDLAKLSLWLATVAKDRPLSFLDHHLRTGDSLVGARIASLQPGEGKRKKKAKVEDAAQLSMLEDDAFLRSVSNAVGSIWLIEESPADTLEEVREQERLYARLRGDLTRRYARLADLATATHFGVEIDRPLWKPLTDYATGRAPYAPPQFARWLEESEALAAERRFFHWELEFPEVFFDRQGSPLGDAAGFDAVVGNPPYVRQESLGDLKPYLAEAYPEVYHGVADIFVYFFDQGFRQLRRGGRLSYISSNSWLRANYATPLRAFLRKETTVEVLVDLGDNRIFADAPDVYPAIHVVRRDPPPTDHTAQTSVFTRGEGLTDFEKEVADKLFPLSIHDQLDTGWQLGDPAGRKVFAKLMDAGKPLGEVVEGQIYYGIKTGLNDAFIVDQVTRNRLVEEDPKSAEIMKPIVRGEDLRPWYQEDEGRWLIVLKSSGDYSWPWSDAGENAETIFRKSYPSLHAHMKRLEERLRKRQDKGRFWWELRSCDYYDVFDRAKIFWPDIAKLPRISLGDSQQYAGNTVYLMPSKSDYLLALLNSRILWFILTRLGQSLGERAGSQRYRLFTQFMSRMPIPSIPEVERDTIGSLAMRITEETHTRYDLHRKTQRRIHTDLGTLGKKLNQKLTAWWNLDFATFRAEVKKVFKLDIPLSERDEWEDWLKERRGQHERLTGEIVRLETELNERVYELFDLTSEEIQVVEESTKYRYGEV